MKNNLIIILLIIFGILVLAVPVLINESYKIISGYVTLWEAKWKKGQVSQIHKT